LTALRDLVAPEVRLRARFHLNRARWEPLRPRVEGAFCFWR